MQPADSAAIFYNKFGVTHFAAWKSRCWKFCHLEILTRVKLGARKIRRAANSPLGNFTAWKICRWENSPRGIFAAGVAPPQKKICGTKKLL